MEKHLTYSWKRVHDLRCWPWQCFLKDPGALIISQNQLLLFLLTHTHYDHIMSFRKCGKLWPPTCLCRCFMATWLQSPVGHPSGLDRHSDLDVDLPASRKAFWLPNSFTIWRTSILCPSYTRHSIWGAPIVFLTIISSDRWCPFPRKSTRIDLPTGSGPQLLKASVIQLLTLSSSYAVYPGHGNDATTYRHEKVFNLLRNRARREWDRNRSFVSTDFVVPPPHSWSRGWQSWWNEVVGASLQPRCLARQSSIERLGLFVPASLYVSIFKVSLK